jgi:hypothetical protein
MPYEIRTLDERFENGVILHPKTSELFPLKI